MSEIKKKEKALWSAHSLGRRNHASHFPGESLN